MKLALAVLMVGAALSSSVNASQLTACNQNLDSEVCHHYLEGVVDGALMYKSDATGVRLQSDSYESRALKYRGGKRFEEANRTYCQSRIPDREVLVTGLAEAFGSGAVKTVDDLNNAMYSLMDCQRLK
ncbi:MULTISPECIES: hypothetical protein [Shewanella]|uniref:hypothetical protein n=1 Tax=Shewanella TaxID=22 RepID=UPI0004B934EC|nr:MULTISPECIES: hypothetical protein [Shewanella]QLE84576.1 hypothetical protein FLM48_05410 [Shewanella sp. Scap07]